jgi:uncharacterized cupredoxin-like copper-binding protein
VKTTVLTVSAIMLAVAIALAVGYVVYDSGAGGNVVVGLAEYHITMPGSVPAGHRTFDVTNHGTEPHEFLVYRTGVKAAALPVEPNGSLNEDSSLLHLVAASNGALKPGETRAVTGTLSPGHYVAVCNLPLHYGLGMRVDITVTK